MKERMVDSGMPEEDLIYQEGGLRWFVGFRQIPSNIPVGSVEAEMKTLSTPDGTYVVRRLLLRPKLRQNKVIEIQVEFYPLARFKEILKTEMKRLSYVKDSKGPITEAKIEIDSCANGLNRISWLLSQEVSETAMIREEIETCKNHLGILRRLITEVEKGNE